MRKTLLFSLPAILAFAVVPGRASTVQYNVSVNQGCVGKCSLSGTIFGALTLADSVANTAHVTARLNSEHYSAPGFPDAAWNWNGVSNLKSAFDALPSMWSFLSYYTSAHFRTEDDEDTKSNGRSNSHDFEFPGGGSSGSNLPDAAHDHFLAADIYNAATNNPSHIPVLTTPGFPVGVTDAPEPGTVVLLSVGLAALALMWRKRAKREPTPRANS